jgi:hypothetical protein
LTRTRPNPIRIKLKNWNSYPTHLFSDNVGSDQIRFESDRINLLGRVKNWHRYMWLSLNKQSAQPSGLNCMFNPGRLNFWIIAWLMSKPCHVLFSDSSITISLVCPDLHAQAQGQIHNLITWTESSLKFTVMVFLKFNSFNMHTVMMRFIVWYHVKANNKRSRNLSIQRKKNKIDRKISLSIALLFSISLNLVKCFIWINRAYIRTKHNRQFIFNFLYAIVP